MSTEKLKIKGTLSNVNVIDGKLSVNIQNLGTASSPAGSNKQIQYNANGNLGGATGFEYNGVSTGATFTSPLVLNGTVTVGDALVSNSTVTLNGTATVNDAFVSNSDVTLNGTVTVNATITGSGDLKINSASGKSVLINNGNIDADFSIGSNNATLGDAYKYDAGSDSHTFDLGNSGEVNINPNFDNGQQTVLATRVSNITEGVGGEDAIRLISTNRAGSIAILSTSSQKILIKSDGDNVFNPTNDGKLIIGGTSAREKLDVVGHINSLVSHAELWSTTATASTGTAESFRIVSGVERGEVTSGTAYLSMSGTTGIITVGSKGGGLYRACVSSSNQSSKKTSLHAHVFISDVAQCKLGFERDIDNVNDAGGSSLCGLLTLTASDTVDFRVNSSVADNVYTFNHLDFNISRIERA